jgi:hypothetical protein
VPIGPISAFVQIGGKQLAACFRGGNARADAFLDQFVLELGEAGIAQGKVTRVNLGVGMREPACGRAMGNTRPTACDDCRRGGCRGRFQPGYGILHLRERMQQRAHVSFAGRHAVRPWRSGGYEPGRIGVWG